MNRKIWCQEDKIPNVPKDVPNIKYLNLGKELFLRIELTEYQLWSAYSVSRASLKNISFHKTCVTVKLVNETWQCIEDLPKITTNLFTHTTSTIHCTSTHRSHSILVRVTSFLEHFHRRIHLDLSNYSALCTYSYLQSYTHTTTCIFLLHISET